MRVIAFLLAAIVVVACGTQQPAPAATSKTVLRIRYMPHGEGGAGIRSWTLSCRPARGTHPRRRRACAELAAHPHALDPATHACLIASIQGAPSAAVTGRLASRHVDRTVRPGCGPAWRALPFALTGHS